MCVCMGRVWRLVLGRVCVAVSMYRATHSIVGTVSGFKTHCTTVGVRQGSPTSCILFVLFINVIIKLLKENCGWDGFLSWLQVLVLMDDTVLLSTSRTGMIHKLSLLKQFCDIYGMTVNSKKTKFLAVNVDVEESAPFILEGMTVQWCFRFSYLGSIFTSDGSVSTVMVAHAQAKMCHVLKFVSFV